MNSLNAFVAPTTEQRQALRDAGWNFHIRYLRGTVEVLGRHGDGYLFPLTAEGNAQLQGFIDECVTVAATEVALGLRPLEVEAVEFTLDDGTSISLGKCIMARNLGGV